MWQVVRQKSQNPLADNIRCEHDWNVFAPKFLRGPDGLPVKIQSDETSEFAEGSANVSVTTFLSGLQKLPKTGGVVISHFDL